MLGIHPKTVQRYIREGKLRAAKIGKSWRVSGHDLSVFTEGTAPSHAVRKSDIPADERIKASSVIDIDVDSRDEAIRIVNTLTAVMNAKPPEYGRSSMHAQFIEPDFKVRVTLWGNIKFMSAMMSSIEVLTEQNEEETK
jgi:excisionase family DNA binding protein